MGSRATWLATAAALAALLAAAGAGAVDHTPDTTYGVDPYDATDEAPDPAADGASPADEGPGGQEAPDPETGPEAGSAASGSTSGSGSGSSDDGYRDGSGVMEAAADEGADHVEPNPVPEAAGSSAEAGGEVVEAQVEVLTTPRCYEGRLTGVTVAYRPGSAAEVPDAVPWADWFREGRWYWGVDNPWDDALECRSEDGAAPAPSSDPPFLAGSPSRPALAGGGAPGPRDAPQPAGSAPAEADAAEGGSGANVGDVRTAAYRSPPTRVVDPGTTALVLAALAIPAGAALYRRLSRDEILENETRAAIYEMVLDEPGITAAEVSDRMDVHYRTARHHLEKLAEFGKIVGTRIQGRIRYFENHQRFGLIQKRVISCLESETKREVLMEIARSGAVPSGEIADRVGVAPSTASHHLGDLEDEDLVAARREGRSVLYRLEDGVLAALLDLAPLRDEGAEAD